MRLNWVSSILILLGCAHLVSAQDTDFWMPIRIPLTASIVSSDSLGYKLGPELGVGLEFKHSIFSSYTKVDFGFRHKVETGDGHEINLDQFFCIKYFCGGINYSYTSTSHWTKGSARPEIGFLYENLNTRIRVNYLFGDSFNNLHGIESEVRYGNSRLFYLAGLSYYKFNSNDHGWRLYSGLGYNLVK